MAENFEEKSKVAPPPPPEVTIRTMDSDIKSLEQSGGASVLPETISLPESEFKSDFKITGYAGPEKSIFSPSGPALEESAVELKSENRKLNWKLIGIIIGILAIIVIFWLLGYFVISPWFFSKEMPAAQ